MKINTLPRFYKTSVFLALVLYCTIFSASAHTGHEHSLGFTSGFAHPWSGLDHMLAMFAVGLWAYQTGKKAVWIIPSSFIGLMSIGFLTGMNGHTLSITEPMILASVMVIGIALFTARKLPLALCSIIVGVFAFFHGYAHGNEMTTGTNSLLYASGFLTSTFALHLAGIATGILSGRLLHPLAMRYAGLAIAVTGLFLGFE